VKPEQKLIIKGPIGMAEHQYERAVGMAATLRATKPDKKPGLRHGTAARFVTDGTVMIAHWTKAGSIVVIVQEAP
jgi:hypothetical protein